MGAAGHHHHGISNAQSFAGIPAFYQNYNGQYFNNAQFLPSYPGDLRMLGQTGGIWQNNPNLGYGGYKNNLVGGITSSVLAQ